MRVTARPDNAKPTSGRLDGLEALRGCAALLVAFQHIFHLLGNTGSIFSRAYVSVDLFFVLSGYVMARSYERKFSSGMPAGEFGRIRLVRLWPTMTVGAVLGLVAVWHSVPSSQALALFCMALAFMPVMGGTVPAFPFNPPTWSILFELLANAAHALFLRFLGVWQLVTLSLICAAILLAGTDTINVGTNQDNFALGIARVLYSYGAGIVIFRVFRDKATLPWWLGLTLLLAVCVGNTYLPDSLRWTELPLVFLFLPLAVVSGLATPLIGRSLFNFLGRISFPLYATHFPVTAMLAGSGVDSIPLILAACIAIAWLVSELVERRKALWLAGVAVQRFRTARAIANS